MLIIFILVHRETRFGSAMETVDRLLESLRISQENGHKEEEEKSCIDLGNIYLDLKQHERAVEFYEKAFSICKETGHKDGERLVCSKIGIVYAALEIGRASCRERV